MSKSEAGQGHSLVIVESPAKSKTINKYLGKNYTVLASYGHIRDLPSKDGSVLPEDDFAMSWEVGSRSSKALKDIKDALKNSDHLILATDPDREGEAISWHIQEFLNEKKLLKDKDVSRVTFNEITKKAIDAAFSKPRELDQDLIDAYLARRALDYLVGFNISPVLWRKLPGSRSAGRVQSVALRIVCEREDEIEKFDPREYWSVTAVLKTEDGAPFEARLTHLSGNKLDKFDLTNEDDAQHAVERIKNKTLSVQTIEKKQVRRNPSAPFITSTLQQEASRKLGFGATRTMQTAQRLYEGIEIKGETVGLITYMRTDGTNLSQDAIESIRTKIKNDYGDKYLPKEQRHYTRKAKNAQEAHEAIRPTDITRTPDQLKSILGESELKLYTLIWRRTIACQMESAVLDQVAVDISDGTDDVILRANGSVVSFDGFLNVYQEGTDDDKGGNEKDRILPPLNEGMATKTSTVTPEQHFTQPPPRYTEASLVKKLEEEGIGRPSTYASILQVLQDRNYVRLENKRFFPEDRGRIVTAFLIHFFTRYVDYDFTAGLEEELDAISGGHVAWKEALRLFWKDFSTAVEKTKDLTITQVIDVLDDDLNEHFFPVSKDNPNPRQCPSCKDGRLGLKLAKHGAFIGCSNYPDCGYTRSLKDQGEGADDSTTDGSLDLSKPVVLGQDDNGLPVTLRKGPYGVYVQLGPKDGEEPKKGEKPKRQGLPKGTAPADMTLESALRLLALPRDIGPHPETGEMIQAGVGRFGPYLKYNGRFISLKGDDDVLTIGMNRAVEVIANAPEKKPKKAAAAKEEKPAAKKATATKKKAAAKKPAAKKKTTKKAASK